MTDSAQKSLERLTARPVDRLLDELVSLRRRIKNGEPLEMPLATFHLKSGRDLVGWVMDHQSTPSAALMIHRPGPDLRNPHPDLSYLDPRSIEAITIHDAPRAAPFISEGRIAGPLTAPRDAPPAPSRLTLKRKIAERSTAVSEHIGSQLRFEVEWTAFPESGEELRALGELIDDVDDAIREIAADDLGKKALSALNEIAFADSSEPAISRRGGAVLVGLRAALGVAGRIPKRDLKAAIEKVL